MDVTSNGVNHLHLMRIFPADWLLIRPRFVKSFRINDRGRVSAAKESLPRTPPPRSRAWPATVEFPCFPLQQNFKLPSELFRIDFPSAIPTSTTTENRIPS